MNLATLPMAKRGRPKGNPSPTQLIRAKPETADIVALVARAQGVTAAELLERLLRPPLLERYAALYPQIAAMKADDDAAAVAEGNEQTPPLPNPLVRHPQTGELVPVADLHQTPPKKKPKG
jgi:hypothetical protein